MSCLMIAKIIKTVFRAASLAVSNVTSVPVSPMQSLTLPDAKSNSPIILHPK